MYRVNSIFTANTLPGATKSNIDDEGFYQKDSKNYQIDPNSKAFQDAFIAAHVQNSMAERDVLQATQDAFKITLVTLDDAKNSIKKAQDAITEAQGTLGAAQTPASGMALGTASQLNVEPAKKAFENARDGLKAEIAKLDSGLKNAWNDFHNAQATQQKSDTEATRATLKTTRATLEAIQTTEAKDIQEITNNARNALKAIQYAQVKPMQEALENALNVFLPVKETFQNSPNTKINAAQYGIGNALKHLNAVMNADVQTPDSEEERARGARNALISRIVLLADDICLQHKSDIQGNAAGMSIFFGTATTLFAGAGALTIGAGANTLSALAAASSSTRSLVDAEVYQQTLAASILLAIDSDRNAKKAPIVDGMKSTTANYPIELAIQQINEYHQSCSFVNGIEVISKAVQQRPKTKSQIQSEIDYLRSEITKNGADINNDELKRLLSKRQVQLLEAVQ